MPLVMDSPAGVNLVRSYGAGQIRVDDQVFTRCCVVSPTLLLGDWTLKTPDELGVTEIATIIELAPQIVLVGYRGPQRFAPRSVRRALADRQIALELMELGAACRTYNVLASEGRRVLAVLLP